MSIKMPKLKYSEDALEPKLSKYEVQLHYGTHTQKYFDVVNELAKGTIYEDLELEYLITKDTMTKMNSKLFLNACQAFNHSFYWQCMTPDKSTYPSDELKQAIDEEFDSMTGLRKKFIESAVNQFGSGWTWLIYDNKRLIVKSLPNAGTPLTTAGQTPLLVCDVWEHAHLYQKEYAANRKDYVEAFWEIIDWRFVSEQFTNAKK